MRREARCRQPYALLLVAMRSLAPAKSNPMAQLAQIAAVDLDRLYYELLECLSEKPLASTAIPVGCDRLPP